MEQIVIEAIVNAPVETVWDLYTEPEHIVKWNAASDDWHTTKSENDVKVGGAFSSRMEAKDGSVGFDFSGTYTAVKEYELIAYKMQDGRKVKVEFHSVPNATNIIISFDPESKNPVDMQRGGWQAILNNFKQYVESKY